MVPGVKTQKLIYTEAIIEEDIQLTNNQANTK